VQNCDKIMWIGFCHTGPILLCIDLFVFVSVYGILCVFVLSCICVALLWAWWSGPDGIEGLYLPSVLWHCCLGLL